MNFQELYATALKTLAPRKLGEHGECGQVAAALLTKAGNVYCGVCIDVPCALGMCAESAAIGAMVTAGESRIVRLAAVFEDGAVLPPCGRCRELISQIDAENASCEVLLPRGAVTTIANLLPERWDAQWR